LLKVVSCKKVAQSIQFLAMRCRPVLWQKKSGTTLTLSLVVRFIGLQTLMKLRDKAKAGLKRMEEIGQMGNAEEVENAEALFGGEEMDDEMFSDEIDSIMAEED
jgi:hypothetical protein